jgi:hypothetical protein
MNLHLLFGYSLYRADIYTIAAVVAFRGVDYVWLAFGDCVHRALGNAGTAFRAFFIDYMRHSVLLSCLAMQGFLSFHMTSLSCGRLDDKQTPKFIPVINCYPA